MLKVRVMPTLLYRDFGLVKGVSFDSWRQIGNAMQAVKVYSMRGVDEMIFLDIGATNRKQDPDYDLVAELADECFMPLTVGGGISSISQVRALLRIGADKIAVNTAAVEKPDLVNEVAARYGAQCAVVSIDAAQRGDGVGYEAVIRSGSLRTGIDVRILAEDMQRRGAGEILLGSVDRDGTMGGYDIDLIRSVVEVVDIPVIASGGAGSPADILTAVRDGGASAVAAAAMFHFTEVTPSAVKHLLHQNGFPVRL
jgi:imidazole glycerol-phosphate synthase subunit HisF